MSSYGVGGIEIGGALIVGTVAVGAALAVLTPVAGGYAVYRTGKVIYDGLVREHQEALERQFKEQARERTRLENAQKTRKAIIEECNSKISELRMSDYWEDSSLSLLAQDVLSELQVIAERKEKQEVVNIELQNERDIQHLKDLVERLKKESILISKNKTENLNMLSFIEKMESLFNGLNVNDYYYVHNVEIDDKEKVVIRKLFLRIDELKEKFYAIVEREVDRFGNYPITSVNVSRIASLFEKISNEIQSVNAMEIEPWILEEKISSIEKAISSYYTYKALLDKEQEKFLTLYLCYKESCEKVGEEYKEAVEFDSIEELEATIKERTKVLDRAKRCADIYSKIGREAYICMAFEMELNRLNYVTSGKKDAELIVNETLRNCHIGGKAIPFYEGEDESMMQIFHVSDDVDLQLIVHSNGTSTMETISRKQADEKAVVETQKKHCAKSKKLEEALKKNWFITANFEEKKPADYIVYEFENKSGSFESATASARAKAENRRVIARKQRRQRNLEKVQARSMALRY